MFFSSVALSRCFCFSWKWLIYTHTHTHSQLCGVKVAEHSNDEGLAFECSRLHAHIMPSSPSSSRQKENLKLTEQRRLLFYPSCVRNVNWKKNMWMSQSNGISITKTDFFVWHFVTSHQLFHTRDMYLLCNVRGDAWNCGWSLVYRFDFSALLYKTEVSVNF